MRLYLSSFGLGNRPDELVALTRGARRAAIVVNALDNRPDHRTHWLTTQTQSLARLGFDVTELDLRHHFGDGDKGDARFRGIDMVWINGGNSFILRRAMRQSGFDTFLKDALDRDAIVYAGFSAATVIVAPSLRGLEAVDDPDDAPLGYASDVIWDGLGLLPFAIVVHYKSDHSESALVEKEVVFYEANGIPYRTLRDGEALVVDGGSQRIVG